ncbi:MAG TPA: ATP-dependent DNA ligase [Chloroflexia bacterium]|nr:ATP-dependent DNA ligase [Chloroflexia bacterium]
MPLLFQTVAEALEALEPITGRIVMTNMLAGLLGQAGPEEIAPLVYLMQGRLAPEYRQKEFGINEKLALRAIAQATGCPAEDVQHLFTDRGDAGLTAAECRTQAGGDTTGSELTIGEVHQALSALAAEGGPGSTERKVERLARLVKSVSPLAAKHITRIVIGRLRIGIGDPTVLDALSLAQAGDKSLRPPLERVYNLSSDIGLVAETLYRDGAAGLATIVVHVGNPVRMALAERADGVDEILKRLGRCSVEPKYDGFRCQVHKNGDDVTIFSRGLENMTGMFPEIAAAVRTHLRTEQAIIEGEAMAYSTVTGKYYPFQETTKRRRIHNIEAMSEQLPLRLVAFDLLLADGEDITTQPYEQRRARLESILTPGPGLRVTDALFTEDAEEMALFYDDSVGEGLEGIVAKKLSGPYQAGKRDFNWIKLKRAYDTALRDTVDVVIVGYDYGQGARAAWGIGSLLCAVYDKEKDAFPTVTRCASGLSNQFWIELGQRLAQDKIDHADPRVISILKPSVWVTPRYVFELQADEVTRSPMHPAGADGGPGYALRFPRIVREREKQPEDTTSVTEVIDLYRMQGHKGESGKRAAKGAPAAPAAGKEEA